MIPKNISSISRIKPDGTKFSLSDLPLNRFVFLGKQYKDSSIVHTVYLRKPSLGNTCYAQPKVKLSGYCSYALLNCNTTGILGVMFLTYTNKTKISSCCISVERNIQLDKIQEETFIPLFILERLDLLVYSSDCGSVIVIPTIISDTSLLVPVT